MKGVMIRQARPMKNMEIRLRMYWYSGGTSLSTENQVALSVLLSAISNV